MLETNVSETAPSLLTSLSPESHLTAIAEILAIAVLRGKARQQKSAHRNNLINNEKTGGEGLALFGQQSVHGDKLTRPEQQEGVWNE